MTEGLSDTERYRLAEMAGALIPGDAALRMPAANDPEILADLEKSIGRDLPAIREALKGYRAGQDINAWYEAGGQPAAALGRLVAKVYYRNDRVLEAIGYEARAPFPKGHVVEQGDWSLLDGVRGRPLLWRDDRPLDHSNDGQADRPAPARRDA
jgi:hypothetical protein